MRRIHISPDTVGNAQVIGCLCDDDDRRMLSEDMVEILLPSGILIEAGWYPEGDPTGAYRITAMKDLQLLSPPEQEGSIEEAAERVIGLAWRFLRPYSNVSSTSGCPSTSASTLPTSSSSSSISTSSISSSAYTTELPFQLVA